MSEFNSLSRLGTACLYPPETPEGSFLKDTWDGNPVEFGDSVTYECEPEQELDVYGRVVASRPRYFIHDKSETSFGVECAANGQYYEPRPWPKCVACK